MEDLAAKNVKVKFSWETFGVPIAIIAIATLFGSLRPVFFSFSNLMNVGRQIAFIGLVAWGQTMIIISGGIDLSVGKMTALISVILATIIKHYASSPTGVVLGIAAALALGILFGALKGLIIGKLNIPPFIATLGFFSIFSGGALTYTSGTTIFGLESEAFKWIGNGTIFKIPITIIYMLVFFFMTDIIFRKTKLGLFTYAIGGNERAARWAGIGLIRYKIAIYVYSSLLAAVAAVIMTSRVNSGQPLLGGDLALQSIAAVCIGGTSLFGGVGNVWGTLFGVILIGILNNGLNILGVSSFIQEMVIGITILVAVFISVMQKRE
jgi:ribose/xylose/arabinose/galactoside ABC-type transport system permease subunit